MNAQQPVIDSWSCPTTIYAGSAAFRHWCEGAATGTHVLVVDAAVWQRHSALLATAGSVATVQIGPDTSDSERLEMITAAMARHPQATILAVGGGSVLDAARLAVLANSDARVRPALAAGTGMAMFPAARDAAANVVCVPTTIGTAAEVSPIAVYRHERRRVMVVSPALRARTAIIDPTFTATVTRGSLAAGLLEPWSRAVVPAVCGQRLLLADNLAAALRQTIEVLGCELAAGADEPALGGGAHAGVSEAWRLAAALSSAQTHTAFLSLGRSAFGHALWPFATELSAAFQVPKSHVLTWLVPAWLDGVALGALGPAFGTPERVHTVLAVSPGDAAVAFRRWCAEMGVAEHIHMSTSAIPDMRADERSPSTPSDVVASITATWLTGGFFLAGVTEAEVAWLVDRTWAERVR